MKRKGKGKGGGEEDRGEEDRGEEEEEEELQHYIILSLHYQITYLFCHYLFHMLL